MYALPEISRTAAITRADENSMRHFMILNANVQIRMAYLCRFGTVTLGAFVAVFLVSRSYGADFISGLQGKRLLIKDWSKDCIHVDPIGRDFCSDRIRQFSIVLFGNSKRLYIEDGLEYRNGEAQIHFEGNGNIYEIGKRLNLLATPELKQYDRQMRAAMNWYFGIKITTSSHEAEFIGNVLHLHKLLDYTYIDNGKNIHFIAEEEFEISSDGHSCAYHPLKFKWDVTETGHAELRGLRFTNSTCNVQSR
jgi:hypothetical protein